jgi:hypothetical protein
MASKLGASPLRQSRHDGKFHLMKYRKRSRRFAYVFPLRRYSYIILPANDLMQCLYLSLIQLNRNNRILYIESKLFRNTICRIIIIGVVLSVLSSNWLYFVCRQLCSIEIWMMQKHYIIYAIEARIYLVFTLQKRKSPLRAFQAFLHIRLPKRHTREITGIYESLCMPFLIWTHIRIHFSLPKRVIEPFWEEEVTLPKFYSIYAENCNFWRKAGY